MQLGFFIQPVHPPSRRYADVLREDQQAVILADRLGFTEAFVGEHLTDRAETITSSLLVIASLAETCPSITFGTGVLPLPNYHPVMAAAQISMLDHMVQGRLLIGVGPGVPPDAEAIGDLGTDRAAKQAEALEHMIRLWTGEGPFDLEGRFYRTSTGRFWNPEIGVGSIVPTFQRPHPPIVLASMRPDSSGPELAGRRGWTGISPAYAGAHVVRAHLERYADGCANAGVPDAAAGWRVARSIFVADDAATAQRHAYDPDGPYVLYFRVMRTKLEKAGLLRITCDHEDDPDSELTLERTLRRLTIAGTPEQVVERLLELRRAVGPFGTLLYTGHDWANPELARRSMELMAREVWPRLLEEDA